LHNSDCIFCKIAAKEIQAKIVAETELSVAFWDISPRQAVHILVIPKAHFANVAELADADPDSLVDLIQLGSKLALEKSTGSFRLSFNTGTEAGQTVFHAHCHITSTTPKADIA
jgi:histidine triad (HIT) family protein